MQDHSGSIANSAGFEPAKLAAHVACCGGVRGFKGAESIADEAFWETDCDILIPAALEGQITTERAQRIKAQLILEGANGPTLTAADDMLVERGVLIIRT